MNIDRFKLYDAAVKDLLKLKAQLPPPGNSPSTATRHNSKATASKCISLSIMED